MLAFTCALATALLGPQMFFTIDWPHNHIFGAEHLKLCFETTEDALAWYGALEWAIGASAVVHPVSRADLNVLIPLNPSG